MFTERICERCHGSGVVNQPWRVLRRRVVDEKGVVSIVETVVGGPDACPECAAMAEAEYQLSRIA